MQVNAEPFVLMAEFLPAQLLARHKHKPEQVDALVFGVAGFLPALSDNEYIALLNREFRFMQAKYDLPSLPRSMWKFAKTRPANFPTTRLAQFSALVYQSTHLFSKLMLAESCTEAEQLLHVSASDRLNPDELYPARHLQKGAMGTQFLHNLLINVVVPVKFLYGKHTINEALCEQALSWLETLGAETNTITKFWKSNGIRPSHALHSQSLLQLHTAYCAKHQCLKCAIGNHILYQHV